MVYLYSISFHTVHNKTVHSNMLNVMIATTRTMIYASFSISNSRATRFHIAPFPLIKIVKPFVVY